MAPEFVCNPLRQPQFFIWRVVLELDLPAFSWNPPIHPPLAGIKILVSGVTKGTAPILASGSLPPPIYGSDRLQPLPNKLILLGSLLTPLSVGKYF